MRLIFVADTAYSELIDQLSMVGTVIKVPPFDTLYDGIKNHIDLHIHVIDKSLYISNEISGMIKNQLDSHHIPYTVIDEILDEKYPGTAYLNAISTKDFFIHNTAITAKALYNYIVDSDKKILDVKQGYCRCTTIPLTDHHFITCDAGIYKTLVRENISAHLIDTGHVTLEGHPYGFLGGSAGVVDDILYFNGDITCHVNYPQIKALCHSLNINISNILGKPLVDIGSILTIKGDKRL